MITVIILTFKGKDVFRYAKTQALLRLGGSRADTKKAGCDIGNVHISSAIRRIN